MKSRLFLPAHPGNQQSCLQENVVRHMLYETCAHIFNKHMLIAQDCVKFRGRGRIAWQRFLANSLNCWFPGCAGKNNLDFVQLLVALGISNISYWKWNLQCVMLYFWLKIKILNCICCNKRPHPAFLCGMSDGIESRNDELFNFKCRKIRVIFLGGGGHLLHPEAKIQIH